jgi:hypothetical protein
MADRRPGQPTDGLDQALHDLGRQLDWPAEPDLLPGIRRRITSQPARQSRLRTLRLAAVQPRFVLPAAALLLIAILVLTISDSTRSTVADRLGLPGVSISADPTATLTPGNSLKLGESTTLDAAIDVTGGSLLLPPDAILGQPDSVYVLDIDGTEQVSYVYVPDDLLPEVGETGVGLLISQFDGTTNDSFIQKQLGRDTTIELVEVYGQRAFWLTGAPHVFYYEHPNGDIYEEAIRLAGNVLLWEAGGKTLRIETTLGLAEAVRIAEAMTPLSP